MAFNDAFQDVMKQAEAMQKRMQGVQQELGNLTVMGKSPLGEVAVHMTGRHEASKVVLRPEVQQMPLEMLEAAIATAINNAVRQVEGESQKKIAELTAGLKLPTDLLKNVDEEKR
ncbi:MAG: YbaB/EbfC family nucleoid-associated protein [Legionellaceae bacterium]|nr:YbaB/EbfC family nucleoid-associated protein [Legionellaceae bacterium]